jgi:hypothetical protein
MKRISSSIATFIIFLSCASVAYGYAPNTCNIQWSPYLFGLTTGNITYSPYAFGVGANGMIYGDLVYNPYASGINHDGLVSDSLFYNPYAFGIGRNGLVSDCAFRVPPRSYLTICNTYSTASRSGATVQTKICYDQGERTSPRQQRDYFTSNGHTTISAYLKNKGINFRTDRILRINGRIISVNYLLEDRNILIKYWNTEEILALQQQPQRAQAFYDSYLEEWKQYIGEFRSGGGQILQILADNNQNVTSKLFESSELSNN